MWYGWYLAASLRVLSPVMAQNKTIFEDRSGSPKLEGKQHGLVLTTLHPSPTTLPHRQISEPMVFTQCHQVLKRDPPAINKNSGSCTSVEKEKQTGMSQYFSVQLLCSKLEKFTNSSSFILDSCKIKGDWRSGSRYGCVWLTQNGNKQVTRYEKCLFPFKENSCSISILRKTKPWYE